MKLRNLLNEGKFREGDIVVPNVGPHKGVKHTIIYDFGNGTYNIQPMGLRPKQIQYALGAAGASEDQLKKVGSTPQKPAPSIIDTSDMKPGQNPFGENINEAPMDDRFAKEYEVSTKAFINHIKHELTSAEGADKSVLKKMLQNLMTVSGYPKLMGRLTGMKENKIMKLKDILNKKQINEVDYSTMKLKSNIDQKWDSAKTMQNDLSQWIESTYAATGNVGDILKALEQVLTRTKNVSKEAPSQVPSFSDFKKGKRF